MRKFLVDIEGTDCSFKATQTRMLRNMFDKDEFNLGPEVSFPTYKESSYFIKNYLGGKYGTGLLPEINCSFYTMDRVIDYYTRWKENYDRGELIFCDRYIGSNLIHQACNIEDDEECKKFCDWILEYENEVCKLPVPDVTILLLMDPELAAPIRAKQKQEEGNKNGLDIDIHEDDLNHLKHAYENAKRVAKMYGWKTVECFGVNDDGTKYIKDRYAIHFEVLNHVMEAYNEGIEN